MCDICLQSPCHPRCPNAADPPAVYVCDGCGDDILDGDYYWDIMDTKLCEDCIDSERRIAEYDPY